jgi:hypothetical protein
VTADGVGNSVDPDYSTEQQDLIAPEVTGILFEYASGTGWISDWDGTQPGLDGTSTQGPPRAIRVTMTLEMTDANGKRVERVITHVIPIRAAIGTTAPAIDTTSDMPTEPSDPSGTGAGTGTTNSGGTP